MYFLKYKYLLKRRRTVPTMTVLPVTEYLSQMTMDMFRLS